MVTVWGTEWLCPPPRACARPPAAARVLPPEPVASESETLVLGPPLLDAPLHLPWAQPLRDKASRCTGLDGTQDWF